MCIVILLLLVVLYACLNVGVEYGAWAGILAFIGIFAIAFWISNESQKQDSTKKKVVEDWKSKVIDPPLEARLESQRKHIDTNMKLAEEAKKIYFAEIVPGAKQFSYNVSYVDIILAKHGKLSQFGGAWHGFDVTEPSYGYRQDEADRLIKEQHQVILWIDEQLRKHGAEEELYFSCNKMHYFPANQARETECGTYRWGPTITAGFKFYSRTAANNAIQEQRNRRK